MTDESKNTAKGNTAFDVTRKIPLALSGMDKWPHASAKLLTIEPIHEASIDRQGHLRISYDASYIGIADIESLLDELGLDRDKGLWWRVIAGWYNYVDENIQANACSTNGACCTRPPSANGISRQQRKISQWHIQD
ncbi:MAG: hypothetical protein WC236_01660 [Gallionellaceae bacterium]|jgi:hypothetical protein